MKTVVLDDDPTGTQSATGVRVLLRWDAEGLATALSEVDAVYLQTNSRAVDEAAAVALCRRIREQIAVAADRLGEQVQVVLRGDSTLRGHVIAETHIFVTDEPILFLPTFPAGGRAARMPERGGPPKRTGANPSRGRPSTRTPSVRAIRASTAGIPISRRRESDAASA